MKVLTVYDSKAEAYLPPFYMRTTAEAIRAYEATCNDPESNMSRYPGDYTLFEIGEWDDEKGHILMYEAKTNLGLAAEFQKEKQTKLIQEVKNEVSNEA